MSDERNRQLYLLIQDRIKHDEVVSFEDALEQMGMEPSLFWEDLAEDLVNYPLLKEEA